MPSCVFVRCRNYTGTLKKNSSRISFHLLPRDELVREKWLRVIRTQRHEYHWNPSQHSRVCSEHFRPEDKYVTKKNVMKLKTTAVPILSEHDELNQPITPPSNLESEREVHYLKSTLKKITLHKHKLQVRNYSLSKKNKRLKEKCNSLKEIVLELQKKLFSYNGSENDIKRLMNCIKEESYSSVHIRKGREE